MSGQDKDRVVVRPSINDVEHAVDEAWIEERAEVLATWDRYPVAEAFKAWFDKQDREV